jgi:methionine sulfoxide reductase heme-binding subunit
VTRRAAEPAFPFGVPTPEFPSCPPFGFGKRIAKAGLPAGSEDLFALRAVMSIRLCISANSACRHRSMINAVSTPSIAIRRPTIDRSLLNVIASGRRKSPRRGAECDAAHGRSRAGNRIGLGSNRHKNQRISSARGTEWQSGAKLRGVHGARLVEKSFGSWRLFSALALATSIAICLGLPRTNFHTARGMEFIILRSVRCALPLFLVAFTASSFATLWPSRGTRWLLSNRRYFGLAFAFGMAWHFSFVAYATWLFGNQLNARETALDVIGLTFLLLLTLTSFRWSARRLGPANWRRLHKTGVYVIWLLATHIYLGNVRGGGDLLHYAGLSLLLAAGLLRLAAWMKQRLRYSAARHSAILSGSPRSSR